MTSPKSWVPPRVLVADDDPTAVLLFEHALEGLGRTYDTAEDGEAAWSLWQEKRHELVVLDIEMPGLDGLEVCRRIRKEEGKRRTFVLMVTGRDKAADLEAGLDAGADDYVTKPITGPRLVARLRIAQRRMMDEAGRHEIQEELQKARWLAGIGEAMVALQHEINNPLAALVGTAELALMHGKEEARGVEDLEVILEQAQRIREVVRRMAELREPKSIPYVGQAKMIDLAGPTQG